MPQREVVLEVLRGQIRGADLLDVLVEQSAAGMRVDDDQLVLAEEERVEAGIGIDSPQLGDGSPDGLGRDSGAARRCWRISAK